ncbi:MAG: NADH-quinone oxidoreductase subunit C [Hyphomonadaceae bacterium]|nr:NADH-quinone oxidoreductase subunit C [Hyphomonadaceae bacterium]
MSAALDDLGAHIASSMTSAILKREVRVGELTLDVASDQIVTVVKFLRDDPRCKFTSFIDLCGVDYPERAKRFDVVYHLLSMQLNHRIRLRVQTGETTPVPSIAGIFPCADWFEREAFDMYGILFSGHPDLRRILTDYGFQGFPLRKDFPLSGHVEVRYDPEQQRVVYEPVKLPQAYRSFDFLSPWEGMTRDLPGDEKAGDKGAKP